MVSMVQINRDGEPMRDTKLEFRILPKRLRVHMPEPSLLRQPSKRGVAAQAAYKHKVANTEQSQRPQRKQKPPIWKHPFVTAGLKTALTMGLGVVVTIGVQKRQGREAPSGETSIEGKKSRKLQFA